MRRVWHLESIYYLVPLADFNSRLTTLSGQYNSKLIKIQSLYSHAVVAKVFAKFNSQNLNGFQVICGLEKNSNPVSSIVESVKVYRIADGSWAQTLVGTLPVNEAAEGVFEAFADRNFLGANELSGAETYLIEATFMRRERMFKAKSYFNHLGCFDNIRELRSHVELLQITKADF